MELEPNTGTIGRQILDRLLLRDTQPGLVAPPDVPPFVSKYTQVIKDRNNLGLLGRIVIPRAEASGASYEDGPAPQNIRWPKDEYNAEIVREWDGRPKKIHIRTTVIHQRAYGMTDRTSDKPCLSTGSVGPCIAVVIWSPVTGEASLGHFDANQNFTTINDMIAEFGNAGPLEVSTASNIHVLWV
jgi:hypothetical protein